MKAALLTGTKSIEVKDIPKPEPGFGEVVIKMEAAFVCGTDVRFYMNGKPGVDENHPLVIGHEIAGVVHAVGDGVAGYEPGMRVAVAPNYGCGICDLCISGHTEMCLESEALGVTKNGGFAEFLLVPEAAVRQGNVSLIPDNVSFGEAALVEPLSCVFNGQEKIGIDPGDTVIVIGSGPIGIMHCLVAFASGAAKVFISDISQERMEMATNIDSRIQQIPAGDPEKVVEELKKKNSGRLANLVITAASVGAIQEQAFSLVGLNGKVLFFGGLPKGKSVVSLDTNEIHYKQLTITGTTRQSLRQYRKCLDLISSGALDMKPIITAEGTLDDVPNAINAAREGKGLKQMIRFSKK
jgi:L-iditol 2-dehydrogenase